VIEKVHGAFELFYDEDKSSQDHNPDKAENWSPNTDWVRRLFEEQQKHHDKASCENKFPPSFLLGKPETIFQDRPSLDSLRYSGTVTGRWSATNPPPASKPRADFTATQRSQLNNFVSCVRHFLREMLGDYLTAMIPDVILVSEWGVGSPEAVARRLVQLMVSNFIAQFHRERDKYNRPHQGKTSRRKQDLDFADLQRRALLQTNDIGKTYHFVGIDEVAVYNEHELRALTQFKEHTKTKVQAMQKAALLAETEGKRRRAEPCQTSHDQESTSPDQ
jgi:hypothetical protein